MRCLRTGAGASVSLTVLGLLSSGPAEGAGGGTVDFNLGAALRTVDDANTGAATALLSYRPRHREVETESFVMSYEFGWGFDAYVFNTFVDAQDAEFYRTSSFDLFGAYYVMKEKPGAQLASGFALRGAVDEAEDASGSLAVWTVKPEVWLELPFTDQRKSRVGPVSVFLGYAFGDDFRNDADVPVFDDRWEIRVEWPFLRGKWGSGGVEMSYAGDFNLFGGDDNFTFNQLTVKKFVGEKGALVFNVGTGELPPDFVDQFRFGASYAKAF
ncbi:MAG: hypothetical protein ACYTKD_28100 [Planctomycetota bacterium]